MSPTDNVPALERTIDFLYGSNAIYRSEFFQRFPIEDLLHISVEVFEVL